MELTVAPETRRTTIRLNRGRERVFRHVVTDDRQAPLIITQFKTLCAAQLQSLIEFKPPFQGLLPDRANRLKSAAVSDDKKT